MTREPLVCALCHQESCAGGTCAGPLPERSLRGLLAEKAILGQAAHAHWPAIARLSERDLLHLGGLLDCLSEGARRAACIEDFLAVASAPPWRCETMTTTAAAPECTPGLRCPHEGCIMAQGHEPPCRVEPVEPCRDCGAMPWEPCDFQGSPTPAQNDDGTP